MEAKADVTSAAGQDDHQPKDCCGYIWYKLRKVYHMITLEPAMFFLCIVWSIPSVVSGQFVIYKSCLHDFDFPNGTCDHLLDGHHDQENKDVQNEVAQYNVYVTIVSSVFPVLSSFFLGSWSDTFGRKPMLYLYFGMNCYQAAMGLVNTYFMSWPKEYLLYTIDIPVSLTGRGHLLYHMTINAFLSDISTPEERSFRMAMMHFASHHAGVPIGTIFGSYLYKQGSYLLVFGISLLGRLLGSILFFASLYMFKWKPRGYSDDEKHTLRRYRLFSPKHIRDSVKTLVKKREKHKRYYLTSYLTIMILLVLPFYGLAPITYNFVRTKFGWEVEKYSQFQAITAAVDNIGQALGIPLFGYLQVRDTLLVPLLASTYVIKNILTGFASQPWMMYVGSSVRLMAEFSFSSLRSLISQCVENDELGKVFALMSSMESVIPPFMAQVYSSLWKATGSLGEPWVGSVFFLAAILFLIPITWSTVLLFQLRCKDLAMLDKGGEDCESHEERYRKTDNDGVQRY